MTDETVNKIKFYGRTIKASSYISLRAYKDAVDDISHYLNEDGLKNKIQIIKALRNAIKYNIEVDISISKRSNKK